MKIRVKQVTKDVPLLVDPEPGFMSLVNHGANQTPWNSLKSADGQRQENSDMALKGKGAKRAGIITRINFSKAQFKDEAAVEKFLTDNNITGCEVVDEQDIFAAKSTELGNYELDTAKSQMTKVAGVTMFVAEVKGDKKPEASTEGTETPAPEGEATEAEKTGDPAPEAAPAAKGASKARVVNGVKVETTKDGETDDSDSLLVFPTQKYDFWSSYMSNEGSLLGVLKDGIDYDGVPPGVDEVISAVYYSAGNVLSGSDTPADKEQKLKQIGEDFAVLTFGLFELFNQATEDAAKSANVDRKAKAASFVSSFSASVTRAAKGDFPQATPDANVSTEKAEPAAEGTTTEPVADDGLNDLKAILGLISSKLDTLGTRLTVVETSQKGVTETLSRSTQPRNDASIIDELAVDDDGDEGPQTEIARINRENEIRRTMGLKAQPLPKANAA